MRRLLLAALALAACAGAGLAGLPGQDAKPQLSGIQGVDLRTSYYECPGPDQEGVKPQLSGIQEVDLRFILVPYHLRIMFPDFSSQLHREALELLRNRGIEQKRPWGWDKQPHRKPVLDVEVDGYSPQDESCGKRPVVVEINLMEDVVLQEAPDVKVRWASLWHETILLSVDAGDPREEVSRAVLRAIEHFCDGVEASTIAYPPTGETGDGVPRKNPTRGESGDQTNE